MMGKQVHNQHWHMLTGEQIVGLFDLHFKGVTIQPNIDIVYQLKMLEVATLELLENRTSSTIYRIRQTGVVYQICQPDGSLFEFDDYENYLLAEPVDELIDRYAAKEPVHVICKKEGKIYIERIKPPRFSGLYTPENPLNNLEIIKWIDPMPQNVSELASITRKAGAFISNYLKNLSHE